MNGPGGGVLCGEEGGQQARAISVVSIYLGQTESTPSFLTPTLPNPAPPYPLSPPHPCRGAEVGKS